MKKIVAILLVLALSLSLMSAAVTVSADSSGTVVMGDANGDENVDMKDVLVIRKAIAGLPGATVNETAADVNGDGSVDMKDVLMIRKFIAGLIESLDTFVKTSGIAVCLANELETLDPALSSTTDGATVISHLFSGLAKWVQDESGKLVIVPDAATELPEGVKNDNGTVTYTYTLRDGLTWSDGKPVTAGDFEFAWKRAASEELEADYGYLFEIVDGYGDGDLNVKALDDKTLQVTLVSRASYWNELIAFQTFMPVREDVVANKAWATDPATFVCNGAYTMAAFEQDNVIVLQKNKAYVDADQIKMDTIEFYLSDDPDEALTNFKNGDWKMISALLGDCDYEAEFPDEFVVAGMLGTYYISWNANEDILPAGSTLTGADAEIARAEIRNALNSLIDRTALVQDVLDGAVVPASSLVAMGMTNPDGTQFYETAGHNNGYVGYYNVSPDAAENRAAAIEVLKKYYDFDAETGKFTNVPVMSFLYNAGPVHQAIGENLQQTLADIGITLELDGQEWPDYLEARKTGDFSVVRSGWIADYNDPITFLDMWVSGSGNNDAGLGDGDHATVAAYNLDLTALGYDLKVANGTWAETFETLISTIKGCTDEDERYALMHLAEDLLMSTGCVCPLYYYIDTYLISRDVHGFFATPTGVNYFMYCTVE